MRLFEIAKQLNWADESNAERPMNFTNPGYTLLMCNIEDVFFHGTAGFTLDLGSPYGGKNSIGNRVDRAISHFNNGEPMDPPEVGYDKANDAISFSNGRHRAHAAYQFGYEYIPMFVWSDGLDKFKELVRTKPYGLVEGETFSRSVKTKYKDPYVPGQVPDVSFEQFIEGNKRVLFTTPFELKNTKLRDQIMAVSTGSELFTDTRGHQHHIFWKEGAEEEAKRITQMYQHEDWNNPEFHAEVGRILQYPENEITAFVDYGRPQWAAQKAEEDKQKN